MNILLFGKHGQLGKAFIAFFQEKGISYEAHGRDTCDSTDYALIESLIQDLRPTHIINCSAYNQVDAAETPEGEKLAMEVNYLAVEHLSKLAQNYQAKFVHFGTDYVFDGQKNDAYTEEDIPNPLNTYGRSKLKGEEAVLKNPTALMLRTSWVYGEGTQNFIYKFLGFAEKKEVLPATFDEISVPTSTRLLVELTMKALEEELSGLFHATASGWASRADWAREILKLKKLKNTIEEVPMSTWNLPAKRPGDSHMSNKKLADSLHISIPTWQEDLARFLG